jgi:integrase
VPANPAASVRGPKHVVKRGKTPVLYPDDARTLLDSIPIKIGPEPKPGEEDNRPTDLIGLRDRAMIGVMCYTFARIGAVVGMRGEDYYQNGKRWWVRLHEKGGKFHELPAHHNAEAYLDAYIAAAGLADDRKAPLFRSAAGKTGQLTNNPLTCRNALDMVKRRAKAAGLSERTCCHTFYLCERVPAQPYPASRNPRRKAQVWYAKHEQNINLFIIRCDDDRMFTACRWRPSPSCRP